MKDKLLVLSLFAVLSLSGISVTFAEEIRHDLMDETKLCGEDAVLADGVCQIIIIEPSHYVNTSPFYQALLMFSLFLWPFFISGAAIFIVLAKTPRYKKSTRIAVTLSGLLVTVGFLIMPFMGIWPQMGA